MNLAEIPFAMIKNSQKHIEMRLNKNGRDKIVPGDEIVFTSQNSGEKLSVRVTLVSKHSSFEELYQHFDKKDLGYLENQIPNPDDMLLYYKKEDIEKYGVLAIGIELL